MMQEPSPIQELKMDWLHNIEAFLSGGDVDVKTRKTNNCSEGSTALPPFYLLPIKKLNLLILISLARWLLQSKLHRKEFRRIQASQFLIV